MRSDVTTAVLPSSRRSCAISTSWALPTRTSARTAKRAATTPSTARPWPAPSRTGECERGILICGTGIGISISANKVKGIRAALCGDCYSAEMTRRHNDANILAMGARVLGPGLALKIVDTFLNTEFEGGRHARRIALISDIENRG